MLIGCHLSISNGFYAMGKTALDIGANTFQFFTRNPQGGSYAKRIDPDDIKKLIVLMEENNFGKIIAHAPYTLNACSATEKTRNFAVQVMKDDLARMDFIPGSLYNFHPGCHVGQGVETGINFIAQMLNTILTPDTKSTVLLETMAGKGSEIGRNFDELKKIIDKIKLQDKIGVCLDTCHVYDAGYDIVNHLDDVLDAFNRMIGIDRLCAIHLNDSRNAYKSHKDRHEKLGYGTIGLNALIKLTQHSQLKRLPFILETPNDIYGYAQEIATIKKAL